MSMLFEIYLDMPYIPLQIDNILSQRNGDYLSYYYIFSFIDIIQCLTFLYRAYNLFYTNTRSCHVPVYIYNTS